MNQLTRNLSLIAIGLAIGFLATWFFLSGNEPQISTYKAAARQDDGSLILERKPDPSPTPAQQVPRGVVVERVVQVKVKPTKNKQPPPTTPTISIDDVSKLATVQGTVTPCDPVTVDLSLVREKDGQRRVIASSPDGEVIDGVDIPIESQIKQRQPKLAVSYIRSFDGRSGGQVQYQHGPLSVGAGALPGTTFVSVGIRF